jgi:hypothetical protein
VTGIRSSRQKIRSARDETDETRRDGSQRRAGWTQHFATRRAGLMEQTFAAALDQMYERRDPI